ncbi:MAG: ribonuclease [Oscillospiraceae bacterium]|nr:ribonuclease [Oscillospiraceae bacterium]
MKRILSVIMAIVMVLAMAGCGGSTDTEGAVTTDSGTTQQVQADNSETGRSSDASEDYEITVIDKDGRYFDKKNVSMYIHAYGHLPYNFITKDEARDLGWEGGSVEEYAPGYAIGGDVFGNREGLLPDAKGRIWYECDIDTDGYHSRGSRRIVFSNDGLIYYTHDHYESFELLYGKE